MPQITFIINKEKTFLGHKSLNDRSTLLLAASASGDCTVKPMLIYQPEKPEIYGSLIARLGHKNKIK